VHEGGKTSIKCRKKLGEKSKTRKGPGKHAHDRKKSPGRAVRKIRKKRKGGHHAGKKKKATIKKKMRKNIEEGLPGRSTPRHNKTGRAARP